MRRLLPIILLFLLPAAAPAARGEAAITVDVGWSNRYRAGRWTPLFVTASDERPRQVILELYAPHDQRYALSIQQSFVISPTPVTVPVYAPLSPILDETVLVLRDADSGRTIARHVISEQPVYSRNGGDPQSIAAGELFVGITGGSNGERLIENQFGGVAATAAYLEPARLPTVAIGYDGIDLLLLNQPDVTRLSIEQQLAIADWVRAGGRLVLWPGTMPTPSEGPLIDILPSSIGDNRTFQLDAAAIRAMGLPKRFASAAGRVLAPAPDAAKIELFGATDPPGYRRRIGFGQTIMLPLDVSGFMFDSTENASKFWKRVLDVVMDLPERPQNVQPNYGYYAASDNPRRAAALYRNLDWLGNVPGAGKFGFSYIAIVLIAMMFIVGPIDWLVLKRLGRQPWTWVTITGWIGLITLAAIYLGHVFKSGELYFRTATLIDEADGARVASTTLTGIYSPQTTEYEFDCDPDGWWAPAAEMFGWSSGALQVEIPTHQDYRGNRPLQMTINLWNLRFLQSQAIMRGEAMIEAKLHASGDQVTGAITNRSQTPLSALRIRTSAGVATLDIASIAPGATEQISARLDKASTFFMPTTQPNQPYYPYWQAVRDTPTTRPATPAVADIAADRSDRIDRLFKTRSGVACVYAEFDRPQDAIRITAPGAKELHYGVVRALVPLEQDK